MSFKFSMDMKNVLVTAVTNTFIEEVPRIDLDLIKGDVEVFRIIFLVPYV